jgi:hypothetical protein
LRRGESGSPSAIPPDHDLVYARFALSCAMCDVGHRRRHAGDATAQLDPAFGGEIRLAEFIADSPGGPASRFGARLPGKPICDHQIDPIWPDSALDQIVVAWNRCRHSADQINLL